MAASSSLACVVVPIYRADLHAYEDAALKRCVEILKPYDIVVVKPQSLDLSGLLDRYGVTRSESFDDEFFKSVIGYNRLLLSDPFYARFAAYEYMLIHQLDAFVFSDQLSDWCRKGYDYIGAPWLPEPRVPGRHHDLYAHARRLVYRWVDRQDASGLGVHGAQYMYAVGNGGFSLRRVEKMREVLRKMPARAQRYHQAERGFRNEDIFFSVEANRYLPRLKVPGFREATGFAWEMQPAVAAVLNHGNLPFGCHGWHRLHRDEWRPVFARVRYSIDELLGTTEPARCPTSASSS